MRTYTHMHTHNYRYTYALQLFKHLRQIQPADLEIDESIQAGVPLSTSMSHTTKRVLLIIGINPEKCKKSYQVKNSNPSRQVGTQGHN